MRPTFQPNRLIQCGNLTHCRINISAHGYSSVHINGIQSKIYIFLHPAFMSPYIIAFIPALLTGGLWGWEANYLPVNSWCIFCSSQHCQIWLCSVLRGEENLHECEMVWPFWELENPPKHFTSSCGLFSPFPKKCTFAACRVLSRMFQVTQTNHYNHVGAFFILH